MDKLLHFYEQELGRLRQATRKYAEAHVNTAASLEIGPDASTDPEVERLLQSVALLNAATQQLIEDGRSDFHKALLQTLQPHFLRPVPACGIAQVDTSATGYNGINSVTRIPRGTSLTAGACKFTTAYEICVAPIAISQAEFRSTMDVPSTLRLPAEATSTLSLTIEATSDSASFDRPLLQKLRIFVAGEPAQRASLTDAILTHSLCICLEVEGAWKVLPWNPFTKVGFDQLESLLPSTAGEQAPRVLTEYLHLPEKFNFVDIELSKLGALCPLQCQRITLHVVLPKLTRLNLRQTSAENFQLSCAPLINLFRGQATQIRLDGRSTAYPVTASTAGCDIYSIDSVATMHRSGAKVFLPFHGASHDADGVFWKLDEQEGTAIVFVDREQRPCNLENGTVLVEFSCSNSEASAISQNLKTEVGTGGLPIRFLSPPMLPGRYDHPRALLDATQSHGTSLEDIQELFRVHHFQEVDAFKCLVGQPSSAWMDLPMGRVHMLGTEFSLTIDEVMLRDRSLTVLAGVLEEVFAARARANRFILLTLIGEGGNLIYRGAPQVGRRRIV